MGVEEKTLKLSGGSMSHEEWSMSRHAYSDLTNVSPLVFLYLLKECYVYGTCKATAKFFALQHQVHQALHNKPRPGPAVFVARCLSLLPIFESHCEGFSHLMIAALRRLLKTGSTQEDLQEAKIHASKLFVIAVRGTKIHDDRILVKMLEVFGIRLTDINEVLFHSDIKNDSFEVIAKAFVDQFISKLLESQSYMTAVTLLEHLTIRHSEESFLHEMLEKQEYRAAEKWAAFMGKPMLCALIRGYVDRKLLKQAYELIKKNNLREEFPEVYKMGKESSLKKLAEKGCWDIAEMRAKSDRQLLEYIVYLAMEAGYSEKVDELCERYSLTGFIKAKETEASLPHIRYLHLDELAIDDIIWVDEPVGLQEATCHIEGCKVIGLDCEWKPSYEKGSKNNKVSIMQIATEKMVFIIDLLKLSNEAPAVLDSCLIRIFHSPRILKLGYNFQCDMKQLAQSYEDFDCFKHFEMLLDIQNVFKEPRGGLSGLTKEVLGVGLNKTRRNSNWEERPLTRNQLEYAALDAAVLIRIFWHVRSQSQSTGVSNENNTQMEWKSHIISHGGDPTKIKKKMKNVKGCNAGIRESHNLSES
ncbi:putative DNA helicase [Helianthus annuus]|nr:putative DNA helicase [Helianthus annuus]KAJ0883766.1 putative DNA helicase [Helianthus annuus]